MRWILIPFTILGLQLNPSSAEALERQLTLSSYWDTNPLEALTAPDPILGIKTQIRMTHTLQGDRSTLRAYFVGQTFIEPQLMENSKLVLNGGFRSRQAFHQRWRISITGDGFKKWVFQENQEAGRARAEIQLQHELSRQWIHSWTGKGLRSRLYNGKLYQLSQQGFEYSITHIPGPQSNLHLGIELAQVNFQDQAVWRLAGDTLRRRDDLEQQDLLWRTTLHYKHQGSLIWGVVLSHEQVRSNSDIAKAAMLMGQIYLSRRVGLSYFLHVVLQGMNKNYQYLSFPGQNLYEDPEERIQNQLHLQLEKDITPQRSVYVQYSFLRNETIFNHWFYEKHVLEMGYRFPG